MVQITKEWRKVGMGKIKLPNNRAHSLKESREHGVERQYTRVLYG